MYKQYADNILHGQIPYINFHPEYPPFALGIFYSPYLFSKDPLFYVFIYQLIVSGAILLGALSIWLWKKDVNKIWIYLTLIFIMQSSPYHFIFERFDIFPAIMTSLATYFFFKKSEKIGWVWLFAGIMTKIYPLVLIPLFFFKSKNKWNILWLILPLVGYNLWLLYATHGTYLQFASTQGFRPSELESFPSSIILGLHFFKNMAVTPVYSHVVQSWGLDIPARLLTTLKLISYGLAILPLALCFKRLKQHSPMRMSVILISAFMICNIVFSPQYLIWLMPFVPFLDFGEIVLFILTVGITSWTFNFWQDWHFANEWLYLLVFTKNLLFLLFYFKVVIGRIPVFSFIKKALPVFTSKAIFRTIPTFAYKLLPLRPTPGTR